MSPVEKGCKALFIGNINTPPMEVTVGNFIGHPDEFVSELQDLWEVNKPIIYLTWPSGEKVERKLAPARRLIRIDDYPGEKEDREVIQKYHEKNIVRDVERLLKEVER